MNSRHLQQADILQNRYGLRVGARLSSGAAELPHDITERLRAARERAVAQRKKAVAVTRLQPAYTVNHQGHTATLNFGDDGMGPWGRLTSVMVVVALAVGLLTIDIVQRYNRASEAADVDAALLTDDLPPAAYTDPGFLQFLRLPRLSPAQPADGQASEPTAETTAEAADELAGELGSDPAAQTGSVASGTLHDGMAEQAIAPDSRPLDSAPVSAPANMPADASYPTRLEGLQEEPLPMPLSGSSSSASRDSLARERPAGSALERSGAMSANPSADLPEASSSTRTSQPSSSTVD